MPLLINESFRAHSGSILTYKIDCDWLDPKSIETLAAVIGRNWSFSSVHGIPTGGTRLAEALQPHVSTHGPAMIVDDVLTTGKSMEKMRCAIGGKPIGMVIFARGSCPEWVHYWTQISEWAVR